MSGTIDQLNFEVIVSDKKFDAQIKEIENKARQFNTNLSNLLNIRRISTQISQKDVENARRLQQAKVDEVRAQERINREKIKTEGLQRKINAQIERATKGYNNQSRILQELQGYALGYLSIHGASQLLSSLVRVTGEFELQRTTLAAMLGDLDKAEGIITRIQGLAVESPFQFKELTTYAKQLSAFSVPAEELFETTKMLADVSAGLGVGMDRIVLAYGQVRSAAFLRGQEVRQFTEAGIPILDELAKQFSELEGRAVSAGEVFDKISARLVPFEMVSKVFKDMTSEGGKFYQMQEIQADTLRGKISNLVDAYEVMLNEIGKSQSENMKGAVDWVRRLMQNYEETGRTLASLVVSYGVYKAALLAIEVVTKTFTTANHGLLNSLVKAGKWLVNNPYTALAAAITAAGYATYKWVTHLSDAEKIQQSVAKSQDKYNQTLASEYSMLNSLYAKLEMYTEGTLEHDKAKAQVMQKYSTYIEQLRQEGREVSNLADIYGDLADKIRKNVQNKFYESSMLDLEQTYKSIEEEAQKALERSLKSNRKEYQFSERDKLILNMYTMGGIDKENAFEKLSESAKLYFNEFNVFLNKQRANMIEAQNSYIQGMDDISDAYQTFQQQVNEKPIDLSLFVKTVQDTLADFGSTSGNKGKLANLWADETTEYYAYIKMLREGYQEVQDKIEDVGTTQKANLPDLKKQKEVIESIAKALGISLEETKGGGGESEEEKRLKNLISILEQLKKQYEELRALGVSDSAITTLFKGYYKNILDSEGADFFDNLDFKSRIEEAIEDLKKIDPIEAEKIIGGVEGDDLDNYIDRLDKAEKAIIKYYQTLHKWTSEDFNIFGEGIALDVSKIASDLVEKYNEIELRARQTKEMLSGIDLKSEDDVAAVKTVFEQEFGEGSWDTFYEEFVRKGEAAIDALANKQKQYERDLAQETVNNLAQKYVKEQTSGLGLNDWSEKSIGQVLKIKSAFESIRNSKVELPQGLIEQLQSANLSIDDFTESVDETFDDISENINDEVLKKVVKLGKLAGGQILDVASSLEEFAEASNNVELANVAKSIGELGDVFSSTMQGFASGGVVGAAISGVGSIATKIIDGMTDAEIATQNAILAAVEYEKTLKEIEFDRLTSSFDGVFGESEYSKILAVVRESKEFAESMKKGVQNITTSSKELKKVLNMQNTYLFGDELGRLKEMFGYEVGDIIVDQRSGWQRFWGTGNDLIKTFNISDFIDSNGDVMGEELRAFLNAYGDSISAENKATIESMLGDYDLYVKAMEEMTSYLTDIFGNVASSMADSFIEAFKASGEAALDYEDIMDDVATNIAKSVIQSTIVDSIFTPEKIKEISNLIYSGDQAGAMAVVEEAMVSAQNLVPGIQSFLETLEPYFKMEDMEGQNLSEGIKRVTEDTAGLLASYINAIRADVSFAKQQRAQANVLLQQILGSVSGLSAPNLLEYQQQIAANTYNTAMHTQAIMEDLRSVITGEGGFTAIRTYS